MDTFKDFSRAVQFSTGTQLHILQEIQELMERKWLAKCLVTGLKDLQRKRKNLEMLYNDASAIMNAAKSEHEYQRAAELFGRQGTYRDAIERREKCLRFVDEMKAECQRQEEERQRQEEAQIRLRKAEKLQRDNEATRAHILKYFESTDGQFSARELRTALSKHKLEARNIQSNCEVLIQQRKLEQHKDNTRTVYCLVGRAKRMAERQARLEAEARMAQEQQQKREQQMKRLQAERDQLQRELQSLGIFAFKRKKEIQARLDEISKQIKEIST